MDNISTSPIAFLTKSANSPDNVDELINVYNQNFGLYTVYLIILTVVFLLVLIYVFVKGMVANVAGNWPAYRCNPMFMPFAVLFGYDASDNFNYCMKNIFTQHAGKALVPVYGMMGEFTQISGTLAASANSTRTTMSNMLLGTETLMSSFSDRIQFFLFTIRMGFIKIQNLMTRLFGGFSAIINMGQSGVQAGINVTENSLFKFMEDMCFDPNTVMIMEDGTSKKLSEIVIGDRLQAVDKKVPIVTSVFVMDGSKTEMVKIGNVLVSKLHYVFYNDTWIKAETHPAATGSDSIPLLVCLNTDTHVLIIDGVVFSDYDESSDPDVAREAQANAEIMLNDGIFDAMDEKTSNYELGLDSRMLISTSGGDFKPITEIKIGDKLMGGGSVTALVKEECTWIVMLPNGHMVSSSQLMWDPTFMLWRRAAFVYTPVKLDKSVVLHHLCVTNNIIETAEFMFRDYREVTQHDMEAPYENAFLEKNEITNR
jgi:hypothetical protein